MPFNVKRPKSKHYRNKEYYKKKRLIVSNTLNNICALNVYS